MIWICITDDGENSDIEGEGGYDKTWIPVIMLNTNHVILITFDSFYNNNNVLISIVKKLVIS